jgi:hypothetical protein
MIFFKPLIKPYAILSLLSPLLEALGRNPDLLFLGGRRILILTDRGEVKGKIQFGKGKGDVYKIYLEQSAWRELATALNEARSNHLICCARKLQEEIKKGKIKIQPEPKFLHVFASLDADELLRKFSPAFGISDFEPKIWKIPLHILKFIFRGRMVVARILLS